MSVKSYWYINFYKQIYADFPTYGGWKPSGGDSFKIALCPPSYTPNQDNQAVFNDITQVTGQGYTSGGQVLTNKTISTATGPLVLGADPVSWAGCVFTVRYAVIYDDTNASPLAKQLVRWMDFGQAIELAGRSLTIIFDGGGDIIISPPPGDTTPPVLDSTGLSTVNGPSLSLVYNEPLDTSSVPATGAYAITVNAVPRGVNSVAVSGSQVTLILASAVSAGDVVLASYTVPGSNPIRDLALNNAAAFSGIAISNSTAPPPVDVTPPVLTAAVINGASLALNYDEALNTSSIPATSSFVVKTDGNNRTLTSVSISGQQVLITLTTPVFAANVVTISYTAGANPIKDLAGNNAANLVNQAVTNDTPGDTTAPLIVVIAINATILEVQYNELLDTSSVPATSAYSVTVNGANRTINAVGIANRSVVLTLSSAVIFTDAVVASYTQPLTNKVRDVNQVNALSFFNQPVQNVTPAPPAPPEPVAPVLSSVNAPDFQSITWNNTNVANETGYDYESAPASGGPWTLRGTRPPDTVTFTWTGASASTTYFMRCSSIGPSGTRYPSNVLSTTTPAGVPVPPPEPTAPTLTSVTAPAATVITWNHTDVSNELGYEYETAAAAAGPWTLRGTNPANSTSFTWNAATSAVTYFMRVSSFGAAGTRYPSNILSVTTPSTDAASFVSQSLALASMPVSTTQAVTVTMRNDGTAIWTAASGYHLYSQNPAGNTTWGLSQVPVQGSILANANAPFNFSITAPAAAGTYNFQWRMRHNTTEFGSQSLNTSITVTAVGSGANFYVATTGSDSNNGSFGSPFRTIAKGLSVMQPGNTLEIAGGTYVEAIINTATPSGISDVSRTIVRGAAGQSVILRGSSGGVTLAVYNKRYITFKNLILDGVNETINLGTYVQGDAQGGFCTRITFEDLEVRNYKADDTGANTSNGLTGNTFLVYRRVWAHHNGTTNTSPPNHTHGIYVTSLDCLVEDCECNNNSGMGIQVYSAQGGVNRTIIRRCRLHDNGSYGYLIGSGDGHLAYNNLLYRNGLQVSISGGGWANNGATNARIMNETCNGNTGYGIRIEAGQSCVVQNVINIGNSVSNALGSPASGSSNNIITGSAASFFTNAAAGDFTLIPGTNPAVNAGVSESTYFTTDFAGNLRPFGTAWDVGAYERQS